ncbi:MAG: DUF4347 domain-containing protein [Phormidesmis sp.]
MSYFNKCQNKNDSLSVLFINPNVEHYPRLLQGLGIHLSAHVLLHNKDGVEQISQYLNQYKQYATISTVHIVSHGTPGCLNIGNRELSLDTLSEYKAALEDWFTPHQQPAPKLCLYGCRVAAGDAGEEFIPKLSNITGAGISASSRPIGHKSLGGTWQLDRTVNMSQPAPIAFSTNVQASWVGLLTTPTNESSQNSNPQDSSKDDTQSQVSHLVETHSNTSILLKFAGQATTLNGRPIHQRTLLHNADTIRISQVATTFDGRTIDGLIRAIDTGRGMTYEPQKGELSCHKNRDRLDELLRVNLQFVETGTEREVCLPNLTAKFWDAESQTAEAVGFSNADTMNLVGIAPTPNVNNSGQFIDNTLTYRLRPSAAAKMLEESGSCNDTKSSNETHNHDNDICNTSHNSSDTSHHNSAATFNDGDDLSYRVTAQFKQFTSTEIVYGITHSLSETAIVLGLQLNALTITKPTNTKNHIESTVSTVSGKLPKNRIPLTAECTIGESLSVLFLDTNVQDYGKLLTSVKPGIHIYALSSREDGIEQITRVLCDRYKNNNIQSLYIVSHGAPGCLYLGTGELNPWSFERYKHQIMRWKASAVYLEGCNVAAGEAGHALITELQMLLNVPVSAASYRREKIAAITNWTRASNIRSPYHRLSSQKSPFQGHVHRTNTNVLALRNR